MAKPEVNDLLNAGVHFGHLTRKWNPNFKPYILVEKNGVHIINLEETIIAIEKAKKYINSIVKKNGEILFVGTKKTSTRYCPARS